MHAPKYPWQPWLTAHHPRTHHTDRLSGNTDILWTYSYHAGEKEWEQRSVKICQEWDCSNPQWTANACKIELESKKVSWPWQATRGTPHIHAGNNRWPTIVSSLTLPKLHLASKDMKKGIMEYSHIRGNKHSEALYFCISIFLILLRWKLML